MSGRLIFGGYNDYLVHLWDTMQGVKVGCVFAHENRVTSLRRAPGTHSGFTLYLFYLFFIDKIKPKHQRRHRIRHLLVGQYGQGLGVIKSQKKLLISSTFLFFSSV